jgi:hypothetical protein
VSELSASAPSSGMLHQGRVRPRYAGIRSAPSSASSAPVDPAGARRATRRMPAPGDIPVADRPRWRRSTITTWNAARAGCGYRSDEHGPRPAG